MFNLTPPEEERARRCLRDAVTIDSMGGYDEPTPAYQGYADQLIAQGLDLRTVSRRLRRFEFEHPSELGSPWQEGLRTSGLNALSQTVGPYGKEAFSVEATLRDLAAWAYKFDVVEQLIKVTKAEHILRAKREGKLGVILNFQNTTYLGADLETLDLYYQLGLRQVQLTYNDLNLVGCGCTERVDGGLSRFGARVVERLNELGILVDLSHGGERTSREAIAASAAPVAFTHTFCRAAHDHDRGKSDALLEAIARKNGYIGIVVAPMFITSRPEASLEDWLDHVDHAVRVAGVDKVGVGTDHCEPYGPLGELANREMLAELGFEARHGVDFCRKTRGYRNWRDYINLSRGLVSRGYTDEEVMGILGNNFLRIFREVVG